MRAEAGNLPLIVEVADSSLRTDRLVKRRLYAAAEVDEYWIADLENDLIHVHRRREEGSYRQVTQHGRGETVSLAAFPDVQVVVDEIFPLC